MVRFACTLGVASARVGGLFVDEMDGPGDVGFGVGDLFDCAVVVVSEDTEACGLALDATLGVFEAAGRIGFFADSFWTNEEIVRAVADASDTYRGMYFEDCWHVGSIHKL